MCYEIDFWFEFEILNFFDYYFNIWREQHFEASQSEFLNKIREENFNLEFYLQVLSNVLQFSIIIYSFEENLCILPSKQVEIIKKHPLVFFQKGKLLFPVISENFQNWMFPESKNQENWNNFTEFTHLKFEFPKESQSFLVPLEKDGKKRKRISALKTSNKKKSPVIKQPIEVCVNELEDQSFESFFEDIQNNDPSV
jgi:hypothetical protein